MPSGTDKTPSPFKIDSASIPGWEHTTLDMSINNPQMLSDGGDYKGAGQVNVVFNIAGKVLAIRYSDLEDLMSIEGAAFVEKMRATTFQTLVINNIYRMTDIGRSSRSNIGFTGPLTLEDGSIAHFKAGLRVPGQRYNVHVYREVRFRFDGVIAGSMTEAAMSARNMLIAGERANEADASDGIITSAVIDLVEDENFEQTKWFNFMVPKDNDPNAPDYVNLANELFGGLVRLDGIVSSPDKGGLQSLAGEDLTWLRTLILKSRYRLGRD